MANYDVLWAEIYEDNEYPHAKQSQLEAALRLAEAIDESDVANANLWRQYLDALSDLRDTNDSDTDPKDEFAEFLQAQIRDAADT